MNNDQKPTITLAQWCAYLPYGITVQSDYIRQGFTANLVDYNNTNSLANGISIGSANYYQCKPLLHPMNEANERLINDIISDVYNDTIDYNGGGDTNSDIGFRKEGDNISLSLMPYCIVQALIAARYDIFSIIGQGLALPIEYNNRINLTFSKF